MPTKGTRDESEGFSAEERAAMRERAREVRAAARRTSATSRADGTADVLAKIAEMPDADRALAEGLHALILECAPQLEPRTWYGMPAYALDGHVLCFFQAAAKFKARYATLGFSDQARLDDGALWPTSFALRALDPETQARVRELVTRAVTRD